MAMIEHYPLYVGVTRDEALDIRMACNHESMNWGDKARAYRAEGKDEDAATCERIRAGYSALWERFAKAMEQAPDPRLAWFDDAGDTVAPSTRVGFD